MTNRHVAREWGLLTSALLVVGAASCGGTAITDDKGSIHAASGGGGNTAGAGNAGSGSGGSGNTVGSGGVGNVGSGGATCNCAPITCGPGHSAVSVPGQCCLTCEPSCASVDCAFPACKPGETPVTLPGECCARCQPAPIVDAGPSCQAGYRPEACHENDYPRCAPNWQTAQDLYSKLWCDASGAVRLERCGTYNTLVTTNSEGEDRYLYDSLGAMVGYVSESWGATHCTAYEPSFVPPGQACAPVELACDAQDGGAGPYCGDGVIETGEYCDGTVPVGATCAALTMGLHVHGSVRCTATCQLDVSQCSQ